RRHLAACRVAATGAYAIVVKSGASHLIFVLRKPVAQAPVDDSSADGNATGADAAQQRPESPREAFRIPREGDYVISVK
ncbi:hypothetical protein HK405_012905, partial [Cladochytrium tenue]